MTLVPFARVALVLFSCLLLSCLLLSPAWALKPSHEADRLVLAAEEAMAEDDYALAEQYLDDARDLGVQLPAEYDFVLGKLLRQRDDLNLARTHLERYVDRAGSDGQNYREALTLITQIERQRSGRSRARTDDEEGTAEIRWATDRDEYLDDLQNLYESDDPTNALLQHINNLLKFYAYGDERVIAASRMGTPTRHRIHTSDRGEIVSLTKIGMGEELPFAEERFSVYGIDPYVKHRCSASSDNCWLLHPVSDERWLQIVENETVAEELARAFAELIKRMQKKG